LTEVNYFLNYTVHFATYTVCIINSTVCSIVLHEHTTHECLFVFYIKSSVERQSNLLMYNCHDEQFLQTAQLFIAYST